MNLQSIIDEANRIDFVMGCEGVPRCECGGIVKPDVVLYDEKLDNNDINSAINEISHADALIIGGTSLVVYPAAGLIRFFNGNRIVVINKSFTSADKNADLVINDSIGETLGKIVI